MVEREIKSGVSPFIFREGLSIVREEFRGVSEDYYIRCMKTGRLNGYDIDIFVNLHQFGYLNSHMLQILFDKTYNSLKHRLAKLKQNGFIVGYQFEHVSEADGVQKTVRTTPYYGLSDSVKNHYSAWKFPIHLPVFTDPINVLKILVRNEFIVDCLVIDKYHPERVVDCLPGFESRVESYSFKAGYAIILKTKTDDGNVCFVPIVTRRENNWQDFLVPNLKIILGSKIPAKADIVIPVVICEDDVHVAQARKEISKDKVIKNLNICYTTDMICGMGDPFSNLLVYAGDEPNGEPIFMRTEFL